MNLKNVTHVTASVSTFGGGIPEALRSLASHEESLGYNIRTIGHKDKGKEITGWPGSGLSALDTKKFPWMTWAPDVGSTLMEQKPAIIHTHGLWSQASITVPRVSHKANIPYLVSPHGMLDEWALNCSKLKKRLAARLFENRHLKGASCLHALCPPEAASIRKYGFEGPVATIPNGVELPETTQKEEETSSRKILLFLGRIHPKKGLANAIRAFAETDAMSEEWIFVIAGWSQDEHLEELKQLCADIGQRQSSVSLGEFLESPTEAVESDIIFIGSAFGKEKDQLLRAADAFILPSFSEGMPMSVLEAWSYCLPVLMTKHCNLPEGFRTSAALQISTKIEEQIESLRAFQRLSHSERCKIGLAGRHLVESRFTWPKIASEMIHVYQWILGEKSRPDCVSLK